MARIDWKVSVTPVEEVGEDAAGGGVKTEVISYNFKKTLGGGNSSQAWDGNDSGEWVNGVNTYVSSEGTTGAISGAQGLWVKHTGFDFADNSNPNTANLTISTASTAICTLGPNEGIFLPKIADATYNFSDDGTPCAVEYAIFT
tara:strand:+ start:7159 stop:7590 length:432 start_codon:yes stop_codon:yes gene_type:complete